MNKWDEEPNELDWVDAKTGYQCRLLRHKSSGHLCGYVQIPEAHPLHGVDYGAEVPEAVKGIEAAVMQGPIGKRGMIEVPCMSRRGALAGDLFDVHGSITFSGEMSGKQGFWYGFDCAHAGDLSPNYVNQGFWGGNVYRDIDYVKAECTSLAEQLSQVST